mmetsp:Transcript_8199/g.14843  ORF Transcript_8199/g.14843 Transcript_8199/m.14843 type:complete len:370 (-) Transcript_8199:967-2076(-)
MTAMTVESPYVSGDLNVATESKQVSKVVYYGSFFVAALILGLGMGIGGMTDPRRANAFFNLFNLGTEYWDPSLLIVFASALVAHAVMYYLVRPLFKQPAFASRYAIPTRTDLNAPLVLGSALFGAGWSLTGLCPGPAMVAFIGFDRKTVIFVVALGVGFALQKAVQARDSKKTPGSVSAGVALALTLASGTALYLFAEPFSPAERAEAAAVMEFSARNAVIGGSLIGFGLGLGLILVGEVLGMSGVVSGLYSPSIANTEKASRIVVVSALFLAGLILQYFDPSKLTNHMHRADSFYVVGGLLVGFGTSMANGCTSGHGISGCTRLSARSIVAVCTFFATNMIMSTVLFLFQVGSGWQTVLYSALSEHSV